MTRRKTSNQQQPAQTSFPPRRTPTMMEVPEQEAASVPKFETLAPLTVRLRHDQVVFLADIERRIMSQRGRGQRRERITKSTIIRGLIDILPDLLIDTEGISDEGALVERLRVPVLK